MVGRKLVKLGALLGSVSLAACGGGGGGGGGSAASAPVASAPAFRVAPPPEPPAPGAALFETAEYNANYALGAIKASSAYAIAQSAGTGVAGQGVTLAVIDSGVDLSHPDLRNQIDLANSKDMIATRPGGATVQDSDGHGTFVAGIIAAEKNGSGVQGVAFNSKILAVRTDQPGTCATSCQFQYADIAAAIDYAVSKGVKVINLSLGSTGAATPAFEAAYQRAVQAGVIIVAAAGNDGGANPIFPARYAAQSLADHRALAVGATDSANQAASFTNFAGDAQSAYLMAPGVNVKSTQLGGGVGTGSGTSFSSPAVAGAAAVLLAHAPHLTPEQVVNLLLTTATPMGDPALFGFGLLNLQAAIEPAGSLSVAQGSSVNGAAASLATTHLALGAAFGDALQGRNAPKASVMALDDYKRAYMVDLAPAIGAARRGIDMESLLSSRRAPSTTVQQVGDNAALALGLTPTDPFEIRSPEQRDPGAQRAQLVSGIGDRGSLAIGRAVPVGNQFGLMQTMGGSADAFYSDAAFTSPYLGLVATPDSAVYGHRLGDGFDLRGGFASDSTDNRSAYAVELGKAWGEGSRVAVQYGSLHEAGGVLAAAGDGALALGGGADTQFVGLSGGFVVSPGVKLLASYNLGWTHVIDADGLLRDFSTLRSSSSSLGIAFGGVLRDQDELGLALSRPLHIDAGTADLSLPQARTIDGQIIRSDQRVGLTPSGAETDAEISYRVRLDERDTLGVNLMLQMQPNHERDAGPAGLATLRWKREF